MNDTIFDQITRGDMKSWKIWESAKHLAFLTPFPNTPGATVVIPKVNCGDDVFELSNTDYAELLEATRLVAQLLKKTLGVSRVALVFEGTGVAYVHAKLFPLYGPLAGQTDVWSETTEFTEEYRGWITTIEGPHMDEAKLDALQKKIAGDFL